MTSMHRMPPVTWHGAKAQATVTVGVIIIGTVSGAMSLIGLQFGADTGRWTGRRREQLAGVILISVGIAIASAALSCVSQPAWRAPAQNT
jgi:putative Mn2+ efflux pump MntP